MLVRITAEQKVPVQVRRNLRRALRRMVASLLPGAEPEVSVSLVGDDRMRELNSLYRGIGSSTDVLAFPQMDGGEIERAKKEPELISGETLGDIVICVPVAEAQAEERGLTLSEEIKTLAAHGLLHLLGFEDETEEGEARMRETAWQVLGTG